MPRLPTSIWFIFKSLLTRCQDQCRENGLDRWDADKERHRIENIFSKIKEFRAIATRYDKTASSFAAGIHLVAGVGHKMNVNASRNHQWRKA